MTTTQSILRRGIRRDGERFVVILGPLFQGLPDTAHGGSVLAVFDAVAGGNGPRSLVGHYRRRVPLDVPLTLTKTPGDHADEFALSDPGGIVLVDGCAATAPLHSPSAEPAAGRRPAGGDAANVNGPSPRTGVAAAIPLPVSRACLACGVDNPQGLQARLAADDDTVTATWTPRPTLCIGQTVAPLALTTLLDETAFWLGALASGESGMTTELNVTLHGAAPGDGPVTVWGQRAATRPRADDPRYWQTDVCATDAGGRLVASATITFVAVRGAARRLATALVDLNPAEIVYRVFPAYAR